MASIGRSFTPKPSAPKACRRLGILPAFGVGRRGRFATGDEQKVEREDRIRDVAATDNPNNAITCPILALDTPSIRAASE